MAPFFSGITTQNRDAYMIAQGLRVLRFTNEQILNDTGKVLD